MPGVLANGRGMRLALVTLAILWQAAFAASAAFATRDLFAMLANRGERPDLTPLLLLGLSVLGIAIGRYVTRMLGRSIGQSFAQDIRQAIPARARKDTHPHSEHDVTLLREWVGRGLPKLLATIILLPATLAVLFIIERTFGIVVGPVYLNALLVMAGLSGVGHFSIQRRPGPSAIRTHVTDLTQVIPETIAVLSALLIIWLGLANAFSTAAIAGALAAIGLSLPPLRDLLQVLSGHHAWRTAHGRCKRLFAQGV